MQDYSQPSSPGDPALDPFRTDIFCPHRIRGNDSPIHEHPLRSCAAIIRRTATEEPSYGEVIILTSPRAGYGKSHLISRIADESRDIAIPLAVSADSGMDWDLALKQVIRQLDGPKSGSSKLEELGAAFLSRVMRCGLDQGVVEERDCPISMSDSGPDLRDQFQESQKSKFPGWLAKKGPILASSIRLPFPLHGFSRDEILFWIEYFGQALMRDGQPLAPGDLNPMQARERFLELMSIGSDRETMLLIFDHLDHFRGSGQSLAGEFSLISERVPNSVIIAAMNDDTWEKTFADELPSALRDRFSRTRFQLDPIDRSSAMQLVGNRLSDLGLEKTRIGAFVSELAEENWNESAKLYPRKIIGDARKLWIERSREFVLPQAASPSESSTERREESVTSGGGSFGPSQMPQAGPSPWNPMSGFPFPKQPSPFEGHSLTYPDRPTNPLNSPRPAAIQRESPFSPMQNPSSLWTDAGSRQGGPWTGNAPAPAETDIPVPAAGTPFSSKPASQSSPPPHNGANGSSHHPSPRKDPLGGVFDEFREKFRNEEQNLALDLPLLEKFVTSVGASHPPLSQSEVSIPGGNSTCLRWDLAEQSVWIGFEPARNIFFYSNILQRLISDPTGIRGKIVCFVHETEPFNENLLTTNGIGKDVLTRYFDFVQLSNRELSLLFASAHFLEDRRQKGQGDEAHALIIRQLNPLWQRLTRTITPAG